MQRGDKPATGHDRVILQVMGVTGAEVFVDPANPSMVVVIHRFASVEAAYAFLHHPALNDAMTRAGVTAPPTIILASSN